MSGFENYRPVRDLPAGFDYGTQWGDTYSCRECGAMVRESHLGTHSEWHEAIDGGEDA
jgi:hypothetical protein